MNIKSIKYIIFICLVPILSWIITARFGNDLFLYFSIVVTVIATILTLGLLTGEIKIIR